MAERWGRCQGVWKNVHFSYVKRMFSTCAVSVVGFVCRPPDRMGPPRPFKQYLFVVIFVLVSAVSFRLRLRSVGGL